MASSVLANKTTDGVEPTPEQLANPDIEDDEEDGEEEMEEEDGEEEEEDDEVEIGEDRDIIATAEVEEKMTLVGLDELDGDADLDIDDEDDLEYDPDILKKLESNHDIISKIHPEQLSISTEELNALVKVVRNKDRIIVDDTHRTYPVLSKYERVRAIGQRVKQLNSGCKAYIAVDKHIDNYIIAEQELKEKILPIIIRRPIPSGACEYWRLQDLEVL